MCLDPGHPLAIAFVFTIITLAAIYLVLMAMNGPRD